MLPNDERNAIEAMMRDADVLDDSKGGTRTGEEDGALHPSAPKRERGAYKQVKNRPAVPVH